MTPASRIALRADVKTAEGFRRFPYVDCCGKSFRDCLCAKQGKLTIGWGRNLEDVGISELEAEVLLDRDLYTAETNASKAFAWFPTLGDVRQRAITELVFNMGIGTLKEFRQTLVAIKAGLFRAASEHLLNSLWAKQVGPTRSQRIARYLKDGR